VSTPYQPDGRGDVLKNKKKQPKNTGLSHDVPSIKNQNPGGWFWSLPSLFRSLEPILGVKGEEEDPNANGEKFRPGIQQFSETQRRKKTLLRKGGPPKKSRVGTRNGTAPRKAGIGGEKKLSRIAKTNGAGGTKEGT